MNFDDISKKVMQFSKDTMTEIQKMNDIRQLNAKVSTENKQLKRLYREMGQKLYEMYKDAELPIEGFDDDFQKIAQSYSAIDLLQDQIRSVKGVVLCPTCNMEVAVGERYCSNCGSKMPEVIRIEDTADDDAVRVEADVVDAESYEETDAETDEDTEDETEEETEVNSDADAEAVEETVPETEADAAADEEPGNATDSEAADEAESGEEPEVSEAAEDEKESDASEAETEPEVSEDAETGTVSEAEADPGDDVEESTDSVTEDKAEEEE